MHYITLAAILTPLAVPVAAFWRLPCIAPLVQQRADPVISPGSISSHLHTIMGGNGFDFDMDYSSTQASTCSSCMVKGDFSNYWIPVLFFQYEDGTFEKVNQFGGGTIYYIHRKAEGERITAFPKGFRMVAGDPFKRSAGTDSASLAISYNCLDYRDGPDERETGGFPSSNCPNGLRAQVFFPSCWDGINVDSADHKSHVSYPDGAHDAGICPESHPVRLMSLFYEVIWDTNAFADSWYGDSQPFVWSMGDPTGYGLHADFLNGWDVELLQEAADICTSGEGILEHCPVFDLYSAGQSWDCKVPDKVQERTTGNLNSLPGCNPVQYGPARATRCGSSSRPTAQPASEADWEVDSDPDSDSGWDTETEADTNSYTDLTYQGWTYLGCAADNYQSRSINSASYTSDDMTNAACTSYCEDEGFEYAGTEYSRECFCGDSFPSDRLPASDARANCDMPCTGAHGEVCGGRNALSLYQRCRGEECGDAEMGIVARDAGISVLQLKNVETSPDTDTNAVRISISRIGKRVVDDAGFVAGPANSERQAKRERHVVAHAHAHHVKRIRRGKGGLREID